MGWDNLGPAVQEPMSNAQAMMIRSLREQHDGAGQGDYSGDVLPKWTKNQARAEINKLQERIEKKKRK